MRFTAARLRGRYEDVDIRREAGAFEILAQIPSPVRAHRDSKAGRLEHRQAGTGIWHRDHRSLMQLLQRWNHPAAKVGPGGCPGLPDCSEGRLGPFDITLPG